MKLNKKNRGITLVALIVTIIILLILSGITIASLTGSGLFEKAKLAKQKSEEAQEKEDEILSDYKNKINKYISGNRSQGNIKDFTPSVTKINSYGFTVNIAKASEDENIACYVHIVNGEFKCASAENQCEITDLKADTEYDLITVAIDKDGNSRKSANIKVKTKTELVFTREYLEQGQTYGTVNITDNNVNGTPGLSITGRSSNLSGTVILSDMLRWYKNIDLSQYNNLQLYIKKGADHGRSNVYIDDNRVFARNYSQLSDEWTKYDIDLSEYSGMHTLTIVGGYTDNSGNTSSNTQYCDIRLNNK